VFRRNWRNREFWRWWWHDQVSFAGQLAILIVAFVLVVGAGWLVADRLTSAKASSGPSVVTHTATVRQVVSTRGRPVVRRVTRTVAGRQIVRTVTSRQVSTATVTTAQVRIVTVTRTQKTGQTTWVTVPAPTVATVMVTVTVTTPATFP